MHGMAKILFRLNDFEGLEKILALNNSYEIRMNSYHDEMNKILLPLFKMNCFIIKTILRNINY